MAALGDYKTVLLREKRIFFVSAGFFQRAITFLIPHVADALEVQKRRNVILEVLMAHRTANDVTRLIQKRIKILRPRQLDRLPCFRNALSTSFGSLQFRH